MTVCVFVAGRRSDQECSVSVRVSASTLFQAGRMRAVLVSADGMDSRGLQLVALAIHRLHQRAVRARGWLMAAARRMLLSNAATV